MQLIFIRMSDSQPQQNQQIHKEGTRDSIYIGKKPLMAYVTSTLIQLANQPKVTIKARGLSIGRAVDVSQIILKRMENAGYVIGDVRIASETVKSEDGRTRNVSTIEIEIKRSS
jgi:archaea-specific DNA-binding protein